MNPGQDQKEIYIMNIAKELRKVKKKNIVKPSPSLAGELYNAGFEPLPITPGYKYPQGIVGWREPGFVPFDGWKDDDYGIGIRTGKILAIDIDIYNQEIVEELLECFNGYKYLIRVGEMPKVLVPVYCEDVTEKLISNAWLSPEDKAKKDAGKKVTASKIEILADGQQFVAYATHPDTKKPYRWSGDFLKHTPPTVSFSLIETLFTKLDELMEEAGWVPATEEKPKGKATGVNKDLDIIIANGVPEGQRNDASARVAGRFFGQGKLHAEVFDLMQEWNT